MKKLSCLFILGLILILAFSFNHIGAQSKVPGPHVNTKIGGYIGQKIDLCIAERIKKQDVQHLVEPFKSRKETRLWQTEFWGKWILSATAAYEYNSDPELFKIIQKAAKDLIATQTPDGYIGNYTPEAQLNHWNIWGCKYTLLGLQAYYDISKDVTALEAAKRLCDYVMTLVGPGKSDIVKTGNYRGMPSSSILEPIVLLYNHTGKKEYLDFAKHIVNQWETAEGPKLITKGMEGVPVAERFPNPPTWWSWENGQKAYEMMSCYDGLLELHKITKDPAYLNVVDMVAQEIIRSEINLAGSGTAFECFYHGAHRQTEPTYHTMETCVTFTWMKLCNQLLQLTRNSVYADQIEKAAYNALLASMKFDGSQIAKYSPLEGHRQEGEEQCGMHINCCNANGPRGFGLLPQVAVQTGQNEIFVNLYGEFVTNIDLGSKTRITLVQNSNYPESGAVEIGIKTDKPVNCTLALRIPLWSESTSVLVNGIKAEGVVAGSYLKLDRVWNSSDKVQIRFDNPAKVVELNGYQAIVRGPVLLARDTRFEDGFVDETAIIQEKGQTVDLKLSDKKPEKVWMSFTAPLVLGTDLEGEFAKPVQVHFCDFASAGNTWEASSRYRVWIKKTLHVMKVPYTKY